MDFYKPDSTYHVFLEVIRLHYQRTRMLLDKIGVYPGQPPMLFVLHHKDGRSQKELSDTLGIKPATITVMLKRMENAGLVERRQDEEDQRVSRAYLTDRGMEVCREVSQTVKVIEGECLKNFTTDEQVLLKRLLMQVKDNLTEGCNKKLDD